MTKEQICTDQQIKERYFPVRCERCGFEGCSCDWDGGGQIADTGDYDDIYCPKCGQCSGEECANERTSPKPPIEETKIPMEIRDGARNHVKNLPPRNGIFYKGYALLDFIAGAKWQSTHKTLEWPSELRIEDAAKAYSEQFKLADGYTKGFAIKTFIEGIQWLKSILK
jgi:hypothetical protein